MTKLSERSRHVGETGKPAAGGQTSTASIVFPDSRAHIMANAGLRRAILAFSVAFVAVAVIVALFGVVRFGSARSGLLYLSGKRIVIEPRSTVIEIPARDRHRDVPDDRELVFTIRNWTETTFTVLGSSATCSCANIRDLPLRVPAGSVTPIYGVLDMRKADAEKTVRLGLITDSPAVPLLNVTIAFSEGEP